MADKPKFYITTAISYPNGAPHIGHAYEVVAADAIARFKRIDGYDVFFMTGTDEHGLKIQQTADRNATTPKALVDEMAAKFRAMAERLNCSFDRFIRTTDRDHLPSTQELWRRMQERGDIYLSKYAGWYSVRDEAYYDEGELTRQPDGSWRAPTGTPVEWIEEESYFFRLSAYQDRLLAHYETEPDFIGPETRRNEIVSFVRSGLQDLSISRTTFDWGLPVPGDPKHVMYVWIDALNNYLTGCGFPDQADPRWRYWPADVHIIGKDIVRFHTVYWPAFLMSAGLDLPKRVFGHGFLFNRGEKMSKSVGNVIDPIALADTYGVDQLRYFFMREVPFGQDGNYSHEAIVNRINADLANDLGNLAQRSLSMIAKNCDGAVPQPGPFSEADRELLRQADGLPEKARAAMDGFALHTALADIWAVVAEANRYFAAQEPWVLRKQDPARMATVLYVTADVLRAVGIMAQPFVPEAAGKLLDLVAVPGEARGMAFVGPGHRLVPGAPLPQPQPIFPRYIEPEAA
jgi:methionyl-tRNA synthetase